MPITKTYTPSDDREDGKMNTTGITTKNFILNGDYDDGELVTNPRAQETTTQVPSSTTTGAETPPQKADFSYADMLNELNPNKPRTKEEIEADKRKEKQAKMFSAIGDGISALSNLYFASKGAPNTYDRTNTMSDKAKKRWDELTKEREGREKQYYDALLNTINLDNKRADADRNYNIALENATTERARKDAAQAETIRHNKEMEAIARQQAQNAKGAAEARQAGQDKQAKDQSALNWAKFNSSEKKNNIEIEKNIVKIALGTGKGIVRISKDALNAANIAYVFSKFPQEIQSALHGKAIYDKITGDKIIGYEPPTQEQYLDTIGRYVEEYPEVQNALREIANLPIDKSAQKEKKAGFKS